MLFYPRKIISLRVLSSPRPWGCFRVLAVQNEPQFVFPTPVGVFLSFSAPESSFPRLPHARGGVSASRSARPTCLWSSPRPWGCFRDIPTIFSGCLVFPTPVGVFPQSCSEKGAKSRLPHARGGVSTTCQGAQK